MLQPEHNFTMDEESSGIQTQMSPLYFLYHLEFFVDCMCNEMPVARYDVSDAIH
jgi:hypothetical protein